MPAIFSAGVTYGVPHWVMRALHWGGTFRPILDGLQEDASRIFRSGPLHIMVSFLSYQKRRAISNGERLETAKRVNNFVLFVSLSFKTLNPYSNMVLHFHLKRKQTNKKGNND